MKILSVIFTMVLMSVNAQAKELIFEKVTHEAFVADYYASNSTGKYGVLVLGGAECGKPMDLANKIAALGYPVLSLAYCNETSLPLELEMIPLEYFEAPKKWLLDQKNTRNDGVIVIGRSKGAELALILASRDDAYKGVIGIAPSSVVWAALLNGRSKIPSSSWSVDNQPLPYVPFVSDVKIDSLLDLHTASLKNKAAVKGATIQTQSILVSTLLLTGGQDQMWPSNDMAVSLCQRINAFKRYNPCQHINYPDAGHLLDENNVIGGSYESNASANKDSSKKIDDFLKKLNDQ